MRGDVVMVRDVTGAALVRRVWDEDARAVYACTEERYTSLLSGGREWPPIGFPREDVFVYDATLLDAIAADRTAWNRATPYTKGE